MKGPEIVAMEQKSSWQRDSHEFDLGKHGCWHGPSGYGARSQAGLFLEGDRVVPGLGLMPASPRKEPEAKL